MRSQESQEKLEPEGEGGQRPKALMAVRWLVAASALLLAAAATAWTARAFLGAGVARPTGVASPSVANGEIWARVGGGDGPSFVYRVNPDDTGETALFNDGQTPSGPGTANPEAVGEEYDWSPDGSRLAYMDWSPFESAYEIFVMHPGGTGVSQITHDNGLDSSPSWSSDGTRIAYASDRQGGFEAGCWGTPSCPSDIYVINADGTEETRLTSGPADESRPDWSPDGTKMVFQSNQDDPLGSDIYVMDADESNVTRLTSSPGWDIAPQWSPDGTKIAFVRYAFQVPLDVWVMNSDGSDLRQLTDTGSDTNISFAWSPDGKEIAFTSPKESQHWQVWVMNADGTDQRRITSLDNDHGDLAWRPVPVTETPSSEPPSSSAVISNGLIAFEGGQAAIDTVEPDGSGLRSLANDSLAGAYSPVWSPDGTRTAFRGYVPGGEGPGANYDIYVMNADGSNLMNLTASGADLAQGTGQSNPTWAPDGTRIAYDQDTPSGSEIWVMNADGSGSRQLTGGATDNAPTWSPDGSRIVFERWAADRPTLEVDIYAVDPEGGMLTRLTQSPGFDGDPAWSPDVSRMAFVSDRDGSKEVYVMNADGTDQTRVTDSLGGDVRFPAWSPDGKSIAFQVLRGDNWDIYVINADGTGLLQLTSEPGDEISPEWAPDGAKIAFAAGGPASQDIRYEGTFEIFVINPDGTGLTRLTEGAGASGSVEWQPIIASGGQAFS